MAATYICKLELMPSVYEAEELNRRFDIARNIFNLCLARSCKLQKKVVSDKEFNKIYTSKDGDRKVKMLQIEESYGYSEGAIKNYARTLNREYGDLLGDEEVENEALHAFNKSLRLFSDSKRKVKQKNKDSFVYIANQLPKSKLQRDGSSIVYGEKLRIAIKANNAEDERALKDNTLFIRISKKEIYGVERFFVWMVQENTKETDSQTNMIS